MLFIWLAKSGLESAATEESTEIMVYMLCFWWMAFWFSKDWVILYSRYPGIFESLVFSINLDKLICCMKYSNISGVSERTTQELVIKLVHL